MALYGGPNLTPPRHTPAAPLLMPHALAPCSSPPVELHQVADILITATVSTQALRAQLAHVLDEHTELGTPVACSRHEGAAL